MRRGCVLLSMLRTLCLFDAELRGEIGQFKQNLVRRVTEDIAALHVSALQSSCAQSMHARFVPASDLSTHYTVLVLRRRALLDRTVALRQRC
jgi:hypothetical protein